MNTLRKDGFFVFTIGCAAIVLGIVYCVYTYTNKPTSRVGAPPEQRGFVLEIGGQPASNYAADLAGMRAVHATAVLLLANPSDPALPEVVSRATSENIVPWLAVAPLEKPEEYRAASEAAAKFCAANNIGNLVVGLRLTESLGDEKYWAPLLSSLRKTAPNVQIIFVSAHEEYMWCTWWGESDILAVSGDFPSPAKLPDDLDKARGLLENSWSSNVHDIIAFSLREYNTGRPHGAAIFDVSIPNNYSSAAEEFYVRALLHQSKRQAPKDKDESAAAGRDPLAAIFLRGWNSELKSMRQVINSEWDESAITYTATAPAPSTGATSTSTTTNP